jgi:pantoate--beta-alanine ligase
VYPDDDPVVRIDAGPVGDRLEGHERPGHFDGVLTVVAKLLHLTSPHWAYFGQKDAQQLWLINRMVKDLDFGVQIVEVPTVRDSDGLALSSRNSYLSTGDRAQALALHQALSLGSLSATAGAGAVLEAAHSCLSQAEVDIDYLELVDPASFDVTRQAGPAILLVAAHVGTTRLIDNVRLVLGAEGE